jgi:RNA polymerase sigma-70 factor (ECF subfamily)
MTDTTTPPSPIDATDRLEPYRRSLMAHCYRMLGSAFDADDAVQETMVRAWRNLDRYEGRGPIEAWLYRIATNVCLNILRGRGRRALPMDLGPASSPDSSLPVPRPGRTWVGPIPDAWVRERPGQLDPADVAIEREHLRLAFITALQRLPPRQRAALILHDVLRWSNQEIAALFETTDASVKSSLQRARATMADAAPGRALDPTVGDLLERYVDAFERYDVDAFVDLLHADATLSMPPHDLWLRGADDIAAWWRRESACRGAHLSPVAANGSPAVAQHRRADDGTFEPFAVVVFDVAGGRIASIHAFVDPRLVSLFSSAAPNRCSDCCSSTSASSRHSSSTEHGSRPPVGRHGGR